MKKTIFCAALITALAMPAFAGTDLKDSKELAPPVPTSDSGVYVAVFGGANLAQNYGNSRGSVSSGPLSETFNLNNSSDHVGAVGGLKVGYNFDSFAIGGDFRLQPAVEGEAFYLGTKTSNSTSFEGENLSYKGTMDDAAFMVNGLVRLKTGTLFTPYVGAGIGFEYLNMSKVTLSSGPESFPLSDSNDVCFAMQAIAGFDIALTQHWTLFTEYKYITAFNPNFDGGSVTGENFTYNADYIGQHLVTAGVKYNF